MAAPKSKQMTEENGDPETATDAESDDGYTPECGIGQFKPAALRMCATMPMFTGFYSISALLTSTLSSFVSSQVTTLEKHFGFSSSQTGFIMAANDVGFLAMILFVSFLASRVHIPRSLGLFTIMFGVSGIFCALPYFLFGAPSPASLTEAGNVSMTSAQPAGSFLGQLCDGVNDTSLNCDALKEDSSGGSQPEDGRSAARGHAGTALALIAVGMVLQGVAKTPRMPFSTFYVDNNLPQVKTGFYMGIIIAVAIMGPVLAFALGGLFSRIYVTLEETTLHYRHPRWIGAWWLGYVTFGCIACVVGLPLFCFPRRIKGGRRGTEPVRPHGEPPSVPGKMSQLVKEFLSALVRLWTNPVYMCVMMSSCTILFAVGGTFSFTPKYMENQFAFPAWRANMAMAGVTLGSACLGSFLGGYVSRRMKMGPAASLKAISAVSAVSVLASCLLLVFSCPQPHVHNSPRSRASQGTSLQDSLDSCACDDGDYFPVCGDDGKTFFSPCHAGCQGTARENYVNCTFTAGGTAIAGMCDYSCNMFYPFVIFFCIQNLFGTLAIIPKLIVYIRSVEERDKAMGLGFNAFMTSISGGILGPVIFGKLIDGICIQWEQRSCTGGGACQLYDNDSFRLKLLGYQLIFRALSFVFAILAFISAKVTKKFDKKDGDGEPLKGVAKKAAEVAEKGNHSLERGNTAETRN
ncbi:solute carrier organic anion transporter family member 2A1-like [Babylonia areolata]|uniref:solute carrier organic anion transporter family member 2A1-like n=1 Tax=Babylonia areolata TaxID=304850 RepID=UPI003FD60F94